MPANLRAIWLASDTVDANVLDTVEVFDLTEGAALPVERSVAKDGVHLVPMARLQPGHSYAVIAPPCDDMAPREVGAFTVDSRDAPLPTTLGAVAVTPSTIASIALPGGPACYDEVVSAVVEVTLDTTEEAFPWRQALRYRIDVDGRPWQDPTTRATGPYPPTMMPVDGSAGFRVWATCDPERAHDSSLTPGVHTLVMHATLPGTDVVLSTEPLHFELTCETTPDASPETETDRPATPTPPLARDAEDDPAAGCQTSTPTRDSSWPWLLGAVLMLLAMRWLNRSRWI